MSQSSMEEVENLVNRATDGLIEHVDAVVILVSWKNEHGRTSSYYHGAGNYFAGRGMMQEALDKEKAKTMAEYMPIIRPPEDDGDEWKQPSVD